MSKLLRAELLKLSSMRTIWLFVAANVAITGALVAAELAFGKPNEADEVRSVLTNWNVSAMLAMVLGLVTTTGENRHGTLTATLLATTDRRGVFAAKAVVHAGAGLTLGLLAAAVTAAVALPWLPEIGAPTPGGGDLLEILLGGLLFAMLWGALGVGLGALIPNQVAAVTGVLLWWLMVEPALGSLVPVINSFGTVGSSAALATAPNFGDLPMWAGGLVAAGWVALALFAGIRLAVRRDVA